MLLYFKSIPKGYWHFTLHIFHFPLFRFTRPKGAINRNFPPCFYYLIRGDIYGNQKHLLAGRKEKSVPALAAASAMCFPFFLFYKQNPFVPVRLCIGILCIGYYHFKQCWRAPIWQWASELCLECHSVPGHSRSIWGPILPPVCSVRLYLPTQEEGRALLL